MSMSAREGWEVVLLNNIAEKRCEGKTGRELQECLINEKHKIFADYDWAPFFPDLKYLRYHLETQENIHNQVNISLNRLERLGYPLERIERIRREFDNPISERDLNVAPAKEYLEQFL